MSPLTATTATLVLMGLSACGPSGFSEPMELGGRLVAPATLERGKTIYNRFCSTCHGYDGKADTAQARQLSPKPRDLTRADYKHTEGAPGSLPTDKDLARVIKHGIPGTGMPAWPNLSDQDLDAVSQYLKTFSPLWATGSAPGAPEKTHGNAP